MSTLKTTPVLGSADQIGASRVFIRFKEGKLQDMEHNLGDSLGAHFILVGFSPAEGMYVLNYVNQAGMILKRIAYSRECILEITLCEGICRIDAPPTKTPISIVPQPPGPKGAA